jgi:hypothetical protein
MLPRWLIKIVLIILRILSAYPAGLAINNFFDGFFHKMTDVEPLPVGLLFALVNGIFGVLCLMPYPRFLFHGKVRFLFLVVILLTTIVWIRFSIFSYHYSSPQIEDYPEIKQEFEALKDRPNGDGFFSEHKENGITLWQIRNADHSIEGLITALILALVPLSIFSIRSYEVKRGITWRNFLCKPRESNT